MQFRYSVYHSINDLPIEWKNYITNDNVCFGIDVVEHSKLDDLQNIYVITYLNEQAVFASYFQLLFVKPIHFNISHRKLQQASLSLALKIVKPTLLVAGNLFRHDMLFYNFLIDDLSMETKQRVYHETINYMVMFTNCSGIFIKDVSKNMAEVIATDVSFMAMPEDVSMEINLPQNWQSFEAYEKSLKHKYLQRCKKIRRSFDGVEIVEFNSQQISMYAKQMEQLYTQVTQKQMVSMGKINSYFFINLKKSLNEKYKVFGFFKDKKLIAFSSAILHHDDYDMNYIGFDYEANHQYNLYFNILFHCLESAIATKSKKLILGRTALEAKAILGCEPDYRFSFYKLRNVIVNWFYKRVALNFREGQGEKWKDRHPFKSEFYEVNP
jgi:predicted N-acyltransferase